MTKPYYQMPLDEPSTKISYFTFYTINETNNLVFTMDTRAGQVLEFGNNTFRGNYSTPLLRAAQQNGAQTPYSNPDQIYDFGTNASVRVVINNPTIAQNMHSMHLHGHDVQVLAFGSGSWSEGDPLNVDNPLRRDTLMMPPDGHVVFQYTPDNPGIWTLHCHVPWHLADGLAVNFLERPDDIVGFGEIPGLMADTCEQWDEWRRNRYIPDEN